MTKEYSRADIFLVKKLDLIANILRQKEITSLRTNFFAFYFTLYKVRISGQVDNLQYFLYVITNIEYCKV